MKSSFIVRDNTPTYFPQSPIRRVTKKNVCPICRKPDWCSVTEDGGLALCMRESVGSVKRARNNAYVHVLRPTWVSRVSAVAAPLIDKCGSAETRQADTDHINEVFSFLLEECLELSGEHGDHLMNQRGLSDTTIAANLYASAPDKNKLPVVCEAMSHRFGDSLHGVAGFYKNGESRWWMPQHRGIFIPVRDAQGRIVGIQSRRDDEGKPKYLWLSSNPENYPSGTSSGTPIHYVKPDLAARSGVAICTEGIIKADIISEYAESATVAIAGVSSFNAETFGMELRLSIPALREVIIAVDADWKDKQTVKEGLFRMGHSLRAAGLDVKVRCWNAQLGNGLDDALLSNERSKV